MNGMNFCANQTGPFRVLAIAAWAACVALAASCASVVPARAQLESGWVRGPLSNVRMIASDSRGGVWRGGVEIVLKSGSHTYWRSPGDSGVPPTFDFAASTNVKSVKVFYPAPKRMEEAGMQIFGYTDTVIFPIDIVAQNADKPVVVALHFQYAACEKICMPAEAHLKLTLDPRAAANPLNGPLAAHIADFAARVPKSLDAPDAPALKISQVAGEKKTWRVAAEPAGGSAEDLFAEGPDGWMFDTKRIAPGLFELTLAEKPADAAGKYPPVTLTLATPGGAFEGVMHLDVAKTTP